MNKERTTLTNQSKDNSLAFLSIFKRTEKIAAAVYLVSDIFPDDDVLKREVRSVAVRSLTYISNFADGRKETLSPSFVDKLPKMLIEILALLDVAHMAGYLSEMNYRIVAQEIEEVIRYCKQIPNDMSIVDESSGIPTAGALNVARFITDNEKTINKRPALRKRHNGHTYRTSTGISNGRQQFRAGNSSDVNSDTGVDRSRLILGIMKDGVKKSIKDISVLLKDCSEKTVQRELLSLVRAGLIKKEGERRWSRYSIAGPVSPVSI